MLNEFFEITVKEQEFFGRHFLYQFKIRGSDRNIRMGFVRLNIHIILPFYTAFI